MPPKKKQIQGDLSAFIKPKEKEEQIQKDTEKKTPKIVGDNSGYPTFEDFKEGLCSWQNLLKSYTSQKKFKDTYEKIKEEYATKTSCRLEDLKVVIVGQDPYHQPKQAMGLCFSVQKGVPPPPSLKNMFKSLQNDPNIKNFKVPNHGDLTKWAQQGVFLLNDILTVVDSTPAAHKGLGWAEFTDEVIKLINKECKGIVFMLWGAPAQKKAKIVDANKHHILKTTHPSPLSASSGFLTANHFSQCNEVLKKAGNTEIDWNLD